MKSLIYSLVLLFIFSCSTGLDDAAKPQSVSNNEPQISKEDSVVLASQIADSLEWERLIDSVETGDKLLMELQEQFLMHLKAKDFQSVQDMLYSEGVYYYTVGRIAKNEFDLSGINKSKGKLDGAYSYGESPEKIVSGSFWLDSITGKLQDSSTIVHADYGAVGYGFTGNYSSDHIDLESMFNGESGQGVSHSPQFRILYSVYVRDYNNSEYLMLEFALENEEWKVYAIGNLEWTP